MPALSPTKRRQALTHRPLNISTSSSPSKSPLRHALDNSVQPSIEKLKRSPKRVGKNPQRHYDNPMLSKLEKRASCLEFEFYEETSLERNSAILNHQEQIFEDNNKENSVSHEKVSRPGEKRNPLDELDIRKFPGSLEDPSTDESIPLTELLQLSPKRSPTYAKRHSRTPTYLTSRPATPENGN